MVSSGFVIYDAAKAALSGAADGLSVCREAAQHSARSPKKWNNRLENNPRLLIAAPYLDLVQRKNEMKLDKSRPAFGFLSVTSYKRMVTAE